MIKVTWTTAERALLKEKAIELFNSPDYEGNLVQALREVQVIHLPQGKWRKLTGSHNVPWLHPDKSVDATYQAAVDEELRFLSAKKGSVQYIALNRRRQGAAVAKQEVTTRAEIAAVTEKAVEAVAVLQAATVDAVKEGTEQIAERVNDNKEVLDALDVLPTKIAEAVVKAITDSELALIFLDLIDAVKGKATAGAVPAVSVDHNLSVVNKPVEMTACVAVAAKKKSEKKMLLFINMFPNNWQEIVRTYGSEYDVRLWDGRSHAMGALERLAKNAHRVYANTDVLNHPQDDKLCVLARDKYVRYTGSTSKLKRVIEAERATGIV